MPCPGRIPCWRSPALAHHHAFRNRLAHTTAEVAFDAGFKGGFFGVRAHEGDSVQPVSGFQVFAVGEGLSKITGRRNPRRRPIT